MIRYRREIDGLRALAVVPVILFHAGFGAFGGGFVGVDVFFVISGYLITSIILAEKQTGSFSLVGFYERRARRILPALSFVMAVCIPIAWLILLPSDMKDFSQSLTAVSVFASNILFWQKSGYFDSAAELKPLLHTWSLAVEEQYYVLFPVFLMLVWRLGRRWIAGVLAAMAIVSLGMAQFLVSSEPAATFFLLPTRGWELLIGALIAVCLAQRDEIDLGQVVNQSVAALGLILIIYGVVAFDDRTPFPSLYALVPTIGAALAILFATPKTLVGQVLGNKLFVGVGLVSYSAYLWHQPLFAFARHTSLTQPSAFALSMLALAAVALAYFSWRFVEMPFRRREGISRTRLFAFAIGASAFFACLGLFGHYTNGFESTYISSLNERQRAILARPRETKLDDGDCHFYGYDMDDDIKRRLDACYEKYGKALLVLGDSHAGNMFRALSVSSSHRFVVGLSHAGCRPHSPSNACQYGRVLEFVAAQPTKIDKVIYTQAGFYLIQDDEGMPGSRDFFRKGSIPLYKPNPLFIDRVVAYLNDVARHVDVVWIGPRIEPHLNVSWLKKRAVRCETRDISIHNNTTATFEGLDGALKRRLEFEKRIRYVSQIEAVAFDSRSDLYDCSAVYWSDSDHWSAQGEGRFGKRIVDALSKARIL